MPSPPKYTITAQLLGYLNLDAERLERILALASAIKSSEHPLTGIILLAVFRCILQSNSCFHIHSRFLITLQ